MIIKVLEKILESPLDCKEIKPVNPKGNQSWIFIGRIDAEAETPVLWPPDAGTLIWKALMLEKIKGRRRRGWQKMRWLDGLINMTVMSFEKAPGDCEGQGSLACCSPWGHKELDTTEWLTVKQKQQNTTPVTLQRTQLSKVKGYRQRSSVVGRTRTRIWLYL